MVYSSEALLLIERTRKTAKMADFKTKFGGAGGYCLPVQNITGSQFYVHSFLFHLGISHQLQRTKLTSTMAIFRVILRQPNDLNPVI